MSTVSNDTINHRTAASSGETSQLPHISQTTPIGTLTHTSQISIEYSRTQEVRHTKHRASVSSEEGYQGDTSPDHSGNTSLQSSPQFISRPLSESMPCIPGGNSLLPPAFITFEHFNPFSAMQAPAEPTYTEALPPYLSVDPEIPYHSDQDSGDSSCSDVPEVEISPRFNLESINTHLKSTKQFITPDTPEPEESQGFMASLDSKKTKFILPNAPSTSIESIYNQTGTPAPLPVSNPEQFPDWLALSQNPAELAKRIMSVETIFANTQEDAEQKERQENDMHPLQHSKVIRFSSNSTSTIDLPVIPIVLDTSIVAVIEPVITSESKIKKGNKEEIIRTAGAKSQ